MLEIKGKVNTAICYAKVIEDEAIEQIRRMCDYPMTEGSRIRIMPRSAARANLDMEEYRREMSGVYTTSVNEATIDEAPMAYKSLEDIIGVISESVDIIEVLKPIYNYKAN